MEAIGFCQDVVFTAFITLIVYFVLPKLLSHLGGYDSTSSDAGLVRKTGFLEQIREEIPEEAVGVSEFRSMSNDDRREKELKGTKIKRDDDVVGIGKSGVVAGALSGEKEDVCVGGRGSDDLEAKVVDECSERPILDEIQEEKGTPVAESQASFDSEENPIREEKVKSTSEAQLTPAFKEDAGLGETNYDERVTGDLGSEISEETKGITTENIKNNNDQHVEEEELLGGEWEGIERSELEKRFDAAMAFVESKSNADLVDGNLRLQLYGLQRVAMEGPCHEPQPMALKVSARAKWNAWQKLGNMNGDMAMEEYMALLSKSIPEWEATQISISAKKLPAGGKLCGNCFILSVDTGTTISMGVVIESEVWESNKWLHVYILFTCFLSIYFCPHSSQKSTAATVFDHSLPSAFLRFERIFLLLFTISSVTEGLGLLYGEYEWEYYGVDKQQMLLCLCVGSAASLCIGSFLGAVSDMFGSKKACLMFYILHFIVAIWKCVIGRPSVWVASICLSLASSIFSFSFETWMVAEHTKLGQRQDVLSDMFWLMNFVESASLICSQCLGNWLFRNGSGKNVMAPNYAILVLAIVSIICVAQGAKGSPQTTNFEDYRASFWTHVISDKRVWLLSWSQACVNLSIAVFWILWAPTIVGDGREVNLGLLFPCWMGAKMLGSTLFPWMFSGRTSIRIEECLVYVLSSMGLILSVVAYDYQDVKILLILFFIFHACVGLVLPSLARLRSMYVPNELRGGMISLSQAPANMIFFLLLVQRGYHQTIANSTILALSAFGLFSAACCMYMLKRSGKQLHQSWHKL
ncbi:OLC1v1011506C1 [Oldenlandia corymbosa var. corymbosa]|uniref:OLC1v1011506C1 n=1 Tax=Oldenlandia corymbosa var. corymbosa TaxID=529605 RepID=A0AAV1DWU6_OLDCO|nr:OLC1v1011506C1 [Oldenlandia corymbosa var. corymbosa]